MTEESEGLPTAAYEHECEDEDCSHKYYSSNSSESIEGTYCGKHRGFSEGGVFEKESELLRKSDVVDWIGEEHDELLLILQNCQYCSNNIDKQLANSSATCKEHNEIAARARALHELLNEVQDQ